MSKRNLNLPIRLSCPAARRQASWRCVALLVLAVHLFPFPVSAQGTPVARPPSAPCRASSALVATPVTSPTIPQSPQTLERAAITLAAENVIACHNSRDWETYVGLIDDALRTELFGSSDAATIVAQLEAVDARGFTLDLSIVSLGEPIISGRGGLVDVSTLEGSILRRQEWRFSRDGNAWVLAEIERETPVVDEMTVGLTVRYADTGLASSRNRLINPGAVMFRIENTTTSPLPVVILLYSRIMTAQSVVQDLSSTSLAPGLFVHWDTIEPMDSTVVVLIDPLPGTYAIAAGVDPRQSASNMRSEDIFQIAVSS